MGTVFVHDDIKTPMQLVLDMPMRTNTLRKFPTLRCPTADEISCFLFDTRRALSFALNHAKTVWVIPGITCREA
jgi:hypothetical protein